MLGHALEGSREVLSLVHTTVLCKKKPVSSSGGWWVFSLGGLYSNPPPLLLAAGTALPHPSSWQHGTSEPPPTLSVGWSLPHLGGPHLGDEVLAVAPVSPTAQQVGPI